MEESVGLEFAGARRTIMEGAICRNSRIWEIDGDRSILATELLIDKTHREEDVTVFQFKCEFPKEALNSAEFRRGREKNLGVYAAPKGVGSKAIAFEAALLLLSQ